MYINTCLNYLADIGTFLAGVSALLALITWKKQIKYKKRYETAENLEKCFKDYVHYFYDYYYIVLKKLRENKQVLCEAELNLEERTILTKKYSSYLYIWEEMEYFLTQKEIKDYSYQPELLQRKLLKMLPIKNNGMDEEGFYKMNLDVNFDAKMIDIRQKGLSQIKKLREK